MSIKYDSKNKVFNLTAKDTSYVFSIHDSGNLMHLYWGKAIRRTDLNYMLRLIDMPALVTQTQNIKDFYLDIFPQEYPSFGNTDLRLPSYQVELEQGNRITSLKYKSHKIYKGKNKLSGLPSTYVEDKNEAETLEIFLADEVTGLKVVLSYTVYEKYNVITRSSLFINEGVEKLKLLRALSCSVDFSDHDFDMLQLSGSWARERNVIKRPVDYGNMSISSRRGASSPQQNPFIALMRKNSDEDNGEVYGFNLVYSGNFLANVEVEQYGTTRVQMGINPFDFSWLLEKGESFQTPEVVMVYSDTGLNGMSGTLHNLYRNRLCRGKYRDLERPILINNWEATYFNFDEDKLKNIAMEAFSLGIELFVLDDGWFLNRNDDTSSLGDWVVDKEKLPGGLNSLAEEITKTGMRFGLWVEPEMVSPNSELYRNHPDWCIHVPNRTRSEGRNQLTLDLSREEVCDYIIDSLSKILSSAPISYIKWDMNRHMSEVGSLNLNPERQKETAHRYMLGLYKILENMTSKFPEVLFESCASGGGRFDPGMLYYMPQTWTSDDTDAIERLKIQYGTSIVYPTITMGCHVSAVPNHQLNRITPLETRGTVAMNGNFGYELDITKMSEDDKKIIKEQVKYYKSIRNIVQFGKYFRILSPFESNASCYMFISDSGDKVIVNYTRILARPNPGNEYIRLKGLDKDADYRLLSNGKVYGGDELMYAGICIPTLLGDFKGITFEYEKRK